MSVWIEMFEIKKTTEQMKTTEQNFYLKKWCFASNLLIKNAERRENGVKARVKKTDAARISFYTFAQVDLSAQ